MSLNRIVLFLHIVGAMGYFVGMGTWLFLLAALRHAQRVEQVRTLTPLMGLIGPLILFSVLLLLAAGLYMAITTWGLLTGWIDVALISLLLIVPLGTAINEPRRRAIDRLAQEASDGPLSRSLEQRTPRPRPLDRAADHDHPAAGHRLPDDQQALTAWLPHRDGGRAGARFGLGGARLSYEAHPRAGNGCPRGCTREPVG